MLIIANMWAAYTMLAIIVIVLVVKATIKLKFGFWGAQPVFHIYDIHYWICPPGIISEELPLSNKYVNHHNIRTKTFAEMTTVDTDRFCRFIRSHYLRGGNAKYSPSTVQITTPLINNQYPSYLTTYEISRTLRGTDGDFVPDSELVGVISARPLTVTLQNDRFTVYYVDNLCVHPDHRKNGIAPDLIQTHHYDSRHKTPEIKVHLFKREGEMTAIVPLVAYFTYMYVLPEMKKPSMPGHASLISVGSANIRDALSLVYRRCSSYSAVVVAGFPTISSAVANDTLQLYMLLYSGKPVALYVLRDPSLTHGKDKAIECCASVRDCDQDLFVLGFFEATRQANKTIGARSLLIECLGDNITLNDSISLNKNLPLLGRSPTAYFLYNYACRSVIPEDAIVLV